MSKGQFPSMNSGSPTPRDTGARLPARRRLRMDRESRQRQLLDCAIRAFAERGNARAGHADVARIARVSVATVFEYFPTRAELLDAVLTETELFLHTVMAQGQGKSSAIGAVMDIFHAFEACVDERPYHMRVWLDWSTSIREDVWPQYIAVQERIIDAFEATIDAGRARGEIDRRVVAEDAARFVVGQAHMVVLMRFARVDRARVIRFMDHMIQTTLPTAGR